MFEFKTKENGFKYIEIKNNSASAKIAVQGAHIFHYEQINQKPILWLSDTSFMEHGEHIRGGIPICWPSFGFTNPELPPHGFARNRMWDLVNIIEEDADTTVIIMEFKDSKKSRREWDYRFHLTAKFTIAKELSVELRTLNKDEKDFKFTQALHTYFNVSDVKNISIKGLENKPYLDAVKNEKYTQEGILKIDKEVDYVYQKVDEDVFLQDATRDIKIQAQGSSSCVVWNPWIEKSKKMSGMRDDAYSEFVCIETANAFDDYKILENGASHTIKVSIS
ncbi:MAG: D-hexose-6-phosphate mutarotase [Sulfurimonas sp.]|nr:D-hexose-6-phosphate mutarotase [Sulfurimonas sp.]